MHDSRQRAGLAPGWPLLAGRWYSMTSERLKELLNKHRPYTDLNTGRYLCVAGCGEIDECEVRELGQELMNRDLQPTQQVSSQWLAHIRAEFRACGEEVRRLKGLGK